MCLSPFRYLLVAIGILIFSVNTNAQVKPAYHAEIQGAESTNNKHEIVKTAADAGEQSFRLVEHGIEIGRAHV